MRYCKTATITETSVKIAPMMLRTMVIESVLSGEAALVGATGFTLADVAVPIVWSVERDDMVFCRPREHWRTICEMSLRMNNDSDATAATEERSDLSDSLCCVFISIFW